MSPIKITWKELIKQVYYNTITGIFIWKISKRGIAGTKSKDGYITITINYKPYLAHILAWFYVHGYWPENMIDHKDQIKHHNWIKNLREATNSSNQQNRGNPKNNTSGIKGVCWVKERKKWMSYIYVKTRLKNIGYYKSFDNAVCARLAGEQCLGWVVNDLNSPAFCYVKNRIQK